MDFDFDLTVFTPPPYGEGSSPRRAFRMMRGILRGDDLVTLGGHYAVTRSVVRGLRASGIRWRVVTSLDNRSSEAVLVLAGQRQVNNALGYRAAGRCAKVLAGPNIVMWPTEEPALDDVDAVIVPSEWVKAAYASDMPSIANKTVVWAAGVDETIWSPRRTPRDPSKVLVYEKGRPSDAANTISYLRHQGYDCIHLTYGTHNRRTYRKSLQAVSISIVVGRSESQGLSLTEAWAMNVPTLVARYDTFFRDLPCSAAPYLTPETGEFWSDLPELTSAIASSSKMRPRAWVIKNQTDGLAAQNLLHIVKAVEPRSLRAT